MQVSSGKPPCGLCGRYTPGARVRGPGECSHCHLWHNHPTAAVVLAWKFGHPPDPPPVARRPLAGGPGTELTTLFTTLGIPKAAGCGCPAFAAWMDRIGPAGCRENLTAIAERLREKAKGVSWAVYAGAVRRAVATGLVLNPLDPFPGLVREAVRRAESRAVCT